MATRDAAGDDGRASYAPHAPIPQRVTAHQMSLMVFAAQTVHDDRDGSEACIGFASAGGRARVERKTVGHSV
jgi:hypothetical protein